MVASVEDYAVDPLGISQRTSSQKHLVLVQADYLPLDTHLTVEFVEELIFFFALDFSFVEVVKNVFVRSRHCLNVFLSLFVLQIRFSVQILGFYVANSLGKRTADEEEVTREVFVVIDFDDLTDLQLAPSFGVELPVARLLFLKFFASLNPPIVFIVVGNVPLNIFVDVFDHGQPYHKAERDKQVRNGPIGVSDWFVQLHQHKNQEVKICTLAKLKHEVER